MLLRILSLSLLAMVASTAEAGQRLLDQQLHHLRQGSREWSDFPEQAEGPSLSLRFKGAVNEREQTLRLRQLDVRQRWNVLLNDRELGRLDTDENDMVVYLAIPPGRLVAGENRLEIKQAGKTADDIRVGEILLDDRPLNAVLSETTVLIDVTDAGTRQPLPCRITIINDKGALMTAGVRSSNELAVRPGVIYTATGKASFGLPAGDYTIHAGRGFEWGIDRVRVALKAGDKVRCVANLVRSPGEMQPTHSTRAGRWRIFAYYLDRRHINDLDHSHPLRQPARCLLECNLAIQSIPPVERCLVQTIDD